MGLLQRLGAIFRPRRPTRDEVIERFRSMCVEAGCPLWDELTPGDAPGDYGKAVWRSEIGERSWPLRMIEQSTRESMVGLLSLQADGMRRIKAYLGDSKRRQAAATDFMSREAMRSQWDLPPRVKRRLP